MAYLKIKVEDDTAELYASYDKRGAEYAVQAQLEKMKLHSPYGRSLMFTPEQKAELGKLLGGAESSPEEILAKLKRALSVSLDGLAVPITEQQRKRAEDRAQRLGMSLKDFVLQRLTEALRYELDA